MNSNRFELVDQETFAVHHYASTVRYKTWGFLKNNKDFLSADLIYLMRHSTKAKMANIFSNKLTKTGHVTSDPAPNPVPDRFIPPKTIKNKVSHLLEKP